MRSSLNWDKFSVGKNEQYLNEVNWHGSINFSKVLIPKALVV